MRLSTGNNNGLKFIMLTRNFKSVLTILVLLLFLAVFFSLQLGTMEISAKETFDALFSNHNQAKVSTQAIVIKQIRLPRIIAAILAGSALAVSGAAYQSMFINPLVSPGLLGVLAGAAFGSALGLIIGGSLIFAQLGAFIFGTMAVVFAIFLAGIFRGNRLIMLLIGGIVSSSFFTSLISILKFVIDTQNELPGIVYWLMGGFSSVSAPVVNLLGPVILVGIIITLMLGKYLNLLSMGEDEAQTLGVRVTLLRNILIVTTTLICSLTVALGGIIGWVGLMIPHIARMIVGPDNRKLLPVSALLGSIYLLLIDNLCRSAFSTEVPIGIVTAIVGVPFFVLVLWQTDKRWN
jgi:iron complex transport system permease protein